jgi:hypothetical protein
MDVFISNKQKPYMQGKGKKWRDGVDSTLSKQKISRQKKQNEVAIIIGQQSNNETPNLPEILNRINKIRS